MATNLFEDMEQKNTIVYKLFAMLTNEKNLAIATKYRFQRITPTYILVYGEKEPEGAKCKEITDEETHNLSSRDFQWLQDANMVLIQEVVNEHKHRESQVRELKKFFDELDKNIKEELKASNGERNEESATE